MLRLSFITPAALALLILLPLIWAIALLAPRRFAAWRFWSSLILRSVIFIALIFALAGAQFVRPVSELATIFLIDASDSVAPAQRERSVQYIEEALGAMNPGDQAGIVVFGDNALVEQAPGALSTISRISSVPIATRTNIQDAIQLGLALFPADTQKRLVLLSDGGENNGRAIDAANLARVRGVPIDVVSLPSARGPDALISAVDLPSAAREGQDIAMNVAVNASFATSGRLQVFVDGQLAAEQDVTIESGSNTFPLRIPAGEAGFRRIEVRLDADGDAEAQNNRAAAFTEVQGPPRILMLASDSSRATNLQSALEAANVRVDLRAPNEAPADLALLGEYAGIIIVDTPSRDLPRPLLEALPIFVRELGRGLAMIGGEESFGAGGYRRTQLEEALPVHLDPQDTSQLPDLALTMVIDHSGSMADTSGGDGRTNLDLAKEAVYQASLGLTRQDQLGLVVFDTEADWILPVQQVPSPVEIEQALSRFGPDGGTNIRAGIELAAQALPLVDAKIKHVILLTDGIADSNYGDLIDQMRNQGVTISTVAIGRDANLNLRQIAEQGGGRFYQVEQVTDVPRIFLQETIVVAGRDIIEEQFTPAVALSTAALRGLDGLPPLYGYNGTELKDSARAFLVTPDGKPILAQWQYGLGRAVAWTSDLKGQWGRDWVSWDQFPAFTSGLLDLLLPPRVIEQLTLQATASGAQAVLELNAQDAQGRPLNDLALEGRLVDPEDQGAPIRFIQVGPGRYRATAPTQETGVYLAQVAATDAQGQPLGAVSAGLAVSYSPEYGEQRQNAQLLRELAEATDGRVDPPSSAIFDPLSQSVGAVREISIPLLWLALLLLPIDIALRRLFLRTSDFLPGFVARLRPARSTAGPTESMSRLSAAKRRAQRDVRAPAEQQRPISAAPPVDVKPTPSVDGRQAAAGTRRDGKAAAAPKPEALASQPAASKPASAEPKPSSSISEEQYARLLAAKRRARGKRGDS
jgi:uncharacterized membrane protein